ncbi:Arginase/deacetylase, partial [Rhodotorula sp. JG-1b]
PRTAVLFQPACTLHRYIRTTDDSTIVERPHRIRAVKVGAAAAWARLEQQQQLGANDDDDLDQLLEGLTLGGGTGRSKYPRGGDFKGKGPFDILDSDAQLPVDHAALRYVHPKPNQPPDNNDDGGWESASSSSSKLSARTASEIPPHLPQGDLYLCPGSEPAIFGALGACCEAVDRIVAGGGRVTAQQQRQQTANVSEDQQDATTSYDRAFVAIRPPGHHCGEANPQGFCFVNNVAVAAAHAHIEHGVDRVVIFDIDLHHGNGTQEIAWRINAEAHGILEERQRRSAAAAALKTPRSIMYASLHDIWSYPCEDGDPTLVAAASLSLNGGHGQYISNVHLEPWDSEVDFHERLYPKYREGLVERAEDFVRLTRRRVEESEEEATRKTLVIVSLGCDASEHESAGMSRHNRNVPTSFYRRFALDATSFAHHHAAGKCLAVLEGGYSDRALASASAAFLSGFAERDPSSSGNDGDGDRKVVDRFTANQERDGWWSDPHLKKLEKACSVAKPRRGGAQSSSSSTMTGLLVGADSGAVIRDPWLARSVEIFAHLEDT